MNKIFKLFISISIPLLIGFSSSFFTLESINSWYMTLEKPFFNPPNWIFGPVWTILYILIGISFFLIWQEKKILTLSKENIIFSCQLFLNFIWSILFFGLQSPLLSLIDIIFLWILIYLNIYFFWKIRNLAGYILIPYILWVSFATILNLSIVILN
jgi:benzodiazapine receptor